jgi:hypothetical protein
MVNAPTKALLHLPHKAGNGFAATSSRVLSGNFTEDR